MKKISVFFFAFIIYTIVMHILNLNSCIIYLVTGIPCMSCGFTRAYFDLFVLDFGHAFFHNPMFWIPLVVIIIEFLIYIKKLSKNIRVPIYLFLVFLMIVSWIIRMILYFPDTYPMIYNKKSLFYTLYSIIF